MALTRKLFCFLVTFFFFQVSTAASQPQVDDILITDFNLDAVFLADASTGNRLIISNGSTGTGTALISPVAIVFETSGNLLLLDETSDAIFRVDPLTGNRTILSNSSNGAGANFSAPKGIDLEANGNIIVADSTVDAVFRVSPVTGNRTIISSSSVGSGTNFSAPTGVAVETSGNILVIDSSLNAILRVNPVTGNRTVLSSSSVGSGPTFSLPREITLNSSGDIYISDSGIQAVLVVNSVTGNRSTLTSSSVGTGPTLSSPRDVAFASTGQVFLLDSGLVALLEINPVNGNRTVISDSATGTGVNFGSPRGLAIVYSTNDAPSANDDSASADEDSVLSVSAASGLLQNDSDPDTGDTISVTAFNATSSLGATVSVGADGSFSYDPRAVSAIQTLAASANTSDSFSYSIMDQNGKSDSAQVEVTVLGINDTPDAVDDIRTSADSQLTIDSIDVLHNDSDPDIGDILSISNFDGTSTLGATITLNLADQTFKYDPSSSPTLSTLLVGQLIEDTFSYEITDGNPVGGTDTATVRITLSGTFVNLPPDPKPSSFGFFMWNGFLDMQNIVALRNQGNFNTALGTARLLDINGGELGSLPFRIAPRSELDFIVNDIPGFSNESYGVVEIQFDNNADLKGDGMLYRFGPDARSVELEMGINLQGHNQGVTYVNYNTIQPSFNAKELLHQVPNWLTITNQEQDEAQFFAVDLYSEDGILIDTKKVQVPARGRRDVQAGHEFPGHNKVGLTRITPLNLDADYQVQLNRYGTNQPRGIAVPTAFSFGISMIARSGSSDELWAPISTGGQGENWIVVTNLGNTQEIKLTFYSNKQNQLAKRRIKLDKFAQTHILANDFFNETGSGAVRINPLGDQAIIAESTFYFRDPATGSITSAYASEAREKITFLANSSATYNLFLGQVNYLKLFNTSNKEVEILMQIHRGLSGAALGAKTITLNSKSGVDLAIDQLPFGPTSNTYGELQLAVSLPEAVLTEMLRVRFDNGMLDSSESLPLE